MLNPIDVIKKVNNYNEIGNSLIHGVNYLKIAEKIDEICKEVEYLTINHKIDWFDLLTIKRNVKDLKNLNNQFQKFALEADQLQNRLIALYDDIGHILNRYFEIKDKIEKKAEEKTSEENNIEKNIKEEKFNYKQSILFKKAEELENKILKKIEKK